jgi:hypothetical protein
VRTIKRGGWFDQQGQTGDTGSNRFAQAPDRGERNPRGAALKTRKAPKVIETMPTEEQRRALRSTTGSDDVDFAETLIGQVSDAVWKANSDSDQQDRQVTASFVAMIGMKPQDELEGMLIGQLIASHNAAMECYRRAMIGTQSFETRSGNLNQANKLSRTFTALIEAFDRHRGKGQQRITVEHVNVHAGGQAIVGAVTPGGSSQKLKEPTDAPRGISHEPGTPMRSADAQWETVPIARGARKAPV